VEVAPILRQILAARELRGTSEVSVRLIENPGTCIVSVTPERLTQVLENLLDNAQSFACTEVRIELCRARGYSVIVFEDDGPGIPEQHLAKIFDRFFSYREGREHAGMGNPSGQHLGLGLAIVKTVVEGYGGCVEANNGSGHLGSLKGARLVVRIPTAGA
jgi:two-component system sensor histidine kinase ChvG